MKNKGTSSDLTHLYDKGTEVFGSLEKFTKWIIRDNKTLENKKPIDIIKTEKGFKLVIAELIRIEHTVLTKEQTKELQEIDL